MKIKLDEKDIFTFSEKNCSINIHRHSKERYSGTPYEIGEIKFYDIKQAQQFAEMIELLSQNILLTKMGMKIGIDPNIKKNTVEFRDPISNEIKGKIKNSKRVQL